MSDTMTAPVLVDSTTSVVPNMYDVIKAYVEQPNKDSNKTNPSVMGFGQFVLDVTPPTKDALAKNPAAAATAPRYILKSKGFTDIQAYVRAGEGFPKDKTHFDDSCSSSAQNELSNLDNKIVAKITETMFGINARCWKFDEEVLGSWLTVTNALIGHCDSQLMYLTGLDGSSLNELLKTILDSKYKDSKNQDDTFKSAQASAKTALQAMTTAASSEQAAAKELVEKLKSFQNDTLKHQTAVKFIEQQCSNGPVVNSDQDSSPKKDASGQPVEPYCKALDSKKAEYLRKSSELTDQYNRDFDDWKYDTKVAATAVTYVWVPVYGWIAGGTTMGVYADRARKAKQDYEDHKREAEQDSDAAKKLEPLITQIATLINVVKGIDLAMQRALDALTEVVTLYSEEQTTYGSLISAITGLSTGVGSENAFLQAAMIHTLMKKAAEKWQHIRELCVEFTQTAVLGAETNIPGVTPPGKPMSTPNV